MTVTLVHYNDLSLTDMAIGECYDKGCYTDPDKQRSRIEKVALKAKHSSVLEFTNFTFRIEASTKVLLEMTRHRMASYACKSSRYTLNKGEIIFESTGHADVDMELEAWAEVIRTYVKRGVSNEITSMMLPQAYQYRWIVQFNARSLQNFLSLRMAKSAHFTIRDVANAMYNSIPASMQYIFDKELNEQH